MPIRTESGLDGSNSAFEWRTERNLTVSHAILWAVVIVTSAFDILTTIVGLGHRLEEGNAVARAFIATYGLPGIGLLKFAALVLLVIAWAVLLERHATKLLIAFAVIYLVTVTWNVMTLAAV